MCIRDRNKQLEPVEEVLAEAVQKARKRLPDIKFSVEVPAELLMVPMDPILIEQVLSNLIENAVIHGKTTTAIHLRAEKTEDGFAAFSVRDNGQGISPALLPHLFDYSIRHASPPSGDGKRNMGLGLSVCSAVVKAHGGRLTAHNLSLIHISSPSFSTFTASSRCIRPMYAPICRSVTANRSSL